MFFKRKIIIINLQPTFLECPKSACKSFCFCVFFFFKKKEKMVFDIDGNSKVYMELKH